MAQHDVVEVGAAEVAEAERLADDPHLAVGVLAQDHGVERAAAEVVHRQRAARLERRRRLVVPRGGFGLADQLHIAGDLLGASAALISPER